MAKLASNTRVRPPTTSGYMSQYQIYHQRLYTDNGNLYYHFKTNMTMTNIMFMIEAIGYAYAVGTPIRCCWTGYAYSPTNDIYRYSGHTAYTGLTPNGVYKSSDGYVCLRAQGYDYYVGFVFNSYMVAPGGYGMDVQITASAFNSTSGNYY